MASKPTDYDALEQVRANGRVAGKKADQRTMVLIAHGLAYNANVDGRLKLTPVGVKKLEERGEQPQGGLF